MSVVELRPSNEPTSRTGEIPPGWKKKVAPKHIKPHHVVPAYEIPPGRSASHNVPFIETKD